MITFSDSYSNSIGNAFENAVILTDYLTSGHINWIQENVVINGSIIQIYSSKDKVDNDSPNAIQHFYNTAVPSFKYESFYMENSEEGGWSLVPVRTAGLGRNIKNDRLLFVKTSSRITKNINLHEVLLENDFSDTCSLHEYFQKEKIKDYRDKEIPPFFLELCRWGEVSNCKNLKTVFISNNNLRLCWFGKNIGTLSNSFEDISRVVLNEFKNVDQVRGCKGCEKLSVCTQCFNLSFLEPFEYCSLRRKIDISSEIENSKTLTVFSTIATD